MCEFGENVEIDAEHANIMNPKFDVFFFKSFDVVFNALDNVKARQYVNSMCVLADVPLIEGGSTGLLGQSYPILPHETECYNCRPHGSDEGEKYAICTIRRYFCLAALTASTPDKVEHCIVWGKELFTLLFGNRSESLLFEEVDSVYMDALQPDSEAVMRDEQPCLLFCAKMMEALFDAEIEKRLAIGSYATSEQKPVRVNVTDLFDFEGVKAGTYFKRSEDHEHVWSVRDSCNILLSWLWRYCLEGKYAEGAVTAFEKDNHGDISIVAAATNLRCYTFHIPAATLFAIKKIAGNIIPAVASTNAIVAGLQVLSAVKLLHMQEKGRKSVAEALRYSYLLKVKNNKVRVKCVCQR